MLRFVALTMLLTVGLYQLSGSLYMGWFALNQDQITLEYCVNRDNPEKECHGKCHRSKVLTAFVELKTWHNAQQVPQFDGLEIILFMPEEVRLGGFVADDADFGSRLLMPDPMLLETDMALNFPPPELI
jgi:hypothetical protein